jgi:hypothetical protein
VRRSVAAGVGTGSKEKKRMRGILMCILVGLVALPGVLSAQLPDPERPRNIVGPGAAHGAFLGTDVLITELAGEPSMGMRFDAAWIGAHRLVAGIGVSALIPPSRPGGAANIESLGYAGVLLGYRLAPVRPVHGTFAVLIGGGGLDMAGGGNSGSDANEAFFVAEPAVGAELNATSFLRLDLGISYRYVGGVDLAALEGRSLSGLTGRVGVRFGRF